MEGDGLAASLSPHMDLGRKPTPAPAQSLIPDSATPASAGGVLVSANNARVHKVQVPVEQAYRISLRLQGLKHTLPEARLTPAIEPARYRPNWTIALRQVAPRRACA